MNLYTGYFAKTKFYEQHGFICISVARYNPPFYSNSKRLSLPILAPNQSILTAYKNKEINEKEYTKLYKRQLNDLNADRIYKKIIDMTYDSDNVILLCYEKSNTFCHRHLIGKWFHTKLGIAVNEYHGDYNGLSKI